MAENALDDTFTRLEKGPIPLTQAVRAINAAAGKPALNYDSVRKGYLQGRPFADQLENGRFQVSLPQFLCLIAAYAPDLANPAKEVAQ